jgi:hypothetical protein
MNHMQDLVLLLSAMFQARQYFRPLKQGYSRLSGFYKDYYDRISGVYESYAGCSFTSDWHPEPQNNQDSLLVCRNAEYQEVSVVVHIGNIFLDQCCWIEHCAIVWLLT